MAQICMTILADYRPSVPVIALMDGGRIVIMVCRFMMRMAIASIIPATGKMENGIAQRAQSSMHIG